MYDNSLDFGIKHFGHYCLQTFIAAENLKLHSKGCFKIKQIIIMPKKGEYVKFKNFERKIKSPFMIHACILKVL